MTNPFSLVIDKMHCGGCVKNVSRALETIPGVEVDAVQIGRATGNFDPTVASVKELLEALTKAGYPARVELG